jgi:hypothetical protein
MVTIQFGSRQIRQKNLGQKNGRLTFAGNFRFFALDFFAFPCRPTGQRTEKWNRSKQREQSFVRQSLLPLLTPVQFPWFRPKAGLGLSLLSWFLPSYRATRRNGKKIWGKK